MSEMIGLLFDATLQTLAMVCVAFAFVVLIGIPLGVLLFLFQSRKNFAAGFFYRVLEGIVNIVRSIPFIILMVAITPLTRWIVGTSIGTVAAMVPLTISAIPFFARIVESDLKEVPFGLIEAAKAMGASTWQIVTKVLISESLPAIVRGMTLTFIALIGYSAMAGAIGGGGLGDVAIRYGYQRFEITVMIMTVLILIFLVQGVQWIGDGIAKRLSHYRE